MKLSALEAEPSFALLGPGFGDGRFLLLRGLSDGPGALPRLVFAGFETAGEHARVLSASSSEPCDLELDVPSAGLSVSLRAEGYAERVEQIREAIARGDVYQVCYTVRAHVSAVPAAQLFAAMCARGVPRFAAWVRFPGGDELVSVSPELFFEVEKRAEGDRVHAQPMKGTMRPGAGGALESSEKDRAELAMITDLLRNDLTRICRPRSVQVENARRFLELPYAVQTVSDIVGSLEPGTTPLDVLAALHPGGSVTGAPKQAALEMIRALESGPRGAYCGALGLWTSDRSVFSLLIRTAVKADDGWTYGVGGGVVYDSSAEGERDELHVKLGALGCTTRSSG